MSAQSGTYDSPAAAFLSSPALSTQEAKRKKDDVRRSLVQEFNMEMEKLNAAEKLKKDLLGEIKTLDNCNNNLKSLSISIEKTVLEQKEESKHLNEEIDENHQCCLKLLSLYQTRCEELSEQFTSAPARYAIQVITDEIEMNTREFENISLEIQDRWAPEIESIQHMMQNQPSICLDIPGSDSTEHTADTLDAFNTNLQGIVLDLNHITKKLELQKTTLLKEESLY